MSWRVKIFTGGNLARLESEVNSFLDSVKGELLCANIEINQSITLREYIILICYQLRE